MMNFSIKGRLVGLLVVSPFLVYPQHLTTVFGTVTDGGQPASSVQVFLGNTTLVTNTDSYGRYRIENVPEGRYDVIVPLKNKIFSTPIVASGEDIEKEIRLALPRPDDSLEFINHSIDRKKYFNAVKNFILGYTGNAGKCVIINPEVIQFRYSREDHVVRAASKKPIEVFNEALGYVIFLWLNDLELNMVNKSYNFHGVSLFREVPPSSNHEQRKLENHREMAYYGSLNHFVRSLLNWKLDDNLFTIYILPPKELPHQISESILFSGQKNDFIEMEANVRVIYSGQLRDRYYERFLQSRYSATRNIYPVTLGAFTSSFTAPDYSNPNQISYLYLNGSPIKLYKNGAIENSDGIVLDGYFNYRECLSNALPLNYQPIKPLFRIGN